ncbi:NAD(+) diphosphatase [Aquibium sp. A9E412]|uniref:NAD(+) diphosphatase n=1 Tax=Aquibium sp. A9E412 TaxID=2976767 RepID=UPI0025B17A60|nr:NAD(+) diphosphatase [Aquibium sp. A9E412]MDN2567325.1 NAD(+) diphosphatase [Aquibium sp. A9E412]
MSFPFSGAPAREPSQFVGFAGNRIDRQSEKRSDDSATLALADPAARVLVMRDGRLHLKIADGRADARFTAAEADALGALREATVLLGHGPRGPVLAAPGGGAPEALPDGVKAVDYRSVYMQGLVDAEALGELAQGAALLAWHANHRFCGRCGAETAMRDGGYRRVCPSCGAQHFPRTDPVAIMLAVCGERCLLGRSPHFPPGMYSCLAGFIEPGETIEAAVRRETHEESGVRIGRVAYHASQPWPFPYSLMIGCFGEALDETVRPDTDELEDCRFFDRAAVRAALARAGDAPFAVPPDGAIATHLIRAWAERG